ncbi:MAG TPA: glycosyltransferase family 1 protein [Nitrospirae bacterium]|nr:spore coat protein SA [bacterium BMS3Abin06]HDH12364.1 glycosyltransferase family 1 protein [Nitrospirota bacterium]HDL20357.1 glycosyltransferase family 1 protein [Nitrospirota bacterium]HDZ01246.1 glycosyltransferase family 1 protein [Nitrospirota bacterium]
MKIALIRKNYTPYGGAENYLNLLAGNLAERGYDVHIFSAFNRSGKNLTVHKIRTIGSPSFLSNIIFAANTRAELKKGYFDCVLSFERTFFQDIYRAGDGCHREWLDRRKSVDSFLKKISLTVNPHHLLLLYLEKECFSNSGTIIANSMMVKKDILRHYPMHDNKIQVIYNGVDLQKFQPAGTDIKADIRNDLGITADKVILFVGSDFKRKGVPTLLKAFSLVERKDIQLLIAGKEAKARYLSMAKKLGINKKVIFRGAEREIHRLYSISDVFVLPTIYDPFSNAALEAMASGIPVITTAYNGASELIENGVQGFVINDPSDAGAFAEKISSVLLHAEDMGRQARLKAEEYPIDNAVDKIIRIISGSGS